MAIETASKVGTFCIIIVMIVALVAAGAIWSVTRWWHSVASGEKLIMLHRAMRSVSHRLSVARDGGKFVNRCHLLQLL